MKPTSCVNHSIFGMSYDNPFKLAEWYLALPAALLGYNYIQKFKQIIVEARYKDVWMRVNVWMSTHVCAYVYMYTCVFLLYMSFTVQWAWEIRKTERTHLLFTRAVSIVQNITSYFLLTCDSLIYHYSRGINDGKNLFWLSSSVSGCFVHTIIFKTCTIVVFFWNTIMTRIDVQAFHFVWIMLQNSSRIWFFDAYCRHSRKRDYVTARSALREGIAVLSAAKEYSSAIELAHMLLEDYTKSGHCIE